MPPAEVFTAVEAIPGDYHHGEPVRASLAAPRFIIHDDECRALFGPSPRISLALQSSDPLYHEAGVFLPSTTQDALFVTSNILRAATNAHEIQLHKLTRSPADRTTWHAERIPTHGCPMPNGGVNDPTSPSHILLCSQGTQTTPGGIIRLATSPPYTATPVVTSYHGRWFNSVNDVIPGPAGDGSIWFTDPPYGHEQGFRPASALPAHVYRYDAATRSLRAVADGFARPNGLCFAPGGDTAYVTDTDWVHGDGTTHDARASTVYAFDVLQRQGGMFLSGKRVFALADAGAPDGIKCDTQGNVWSGCGDGVHVWAPDGRLLGKVGVPGGVANFCFGRPGELFLLNETRLWVVEIDKGVRGALLDGLGVVVD